MGKIELIEKVVLACVFICPLAYATQQHDDPNEMDSFQIQPHQYNNHISAELKDTTRVLVSREPQAHQVDHREAVEAKVLDVPKGQPTDMYADGYVAFEDGTKRSNMHCTNKDDTITCEW